MKRLLAVLALMLLATAACASVPPVVWWSDDFSYPDGRLNYQGGWQEGNETDQIRVVNGAVEIYGMQGQREIKNRFSTPFTADEIWFHFTASGGENTGTTWGIWINDPLGRNLARFYGQPNTCRGRIGDLGIVTGQPTLTGGGAWDDLDIKITPSAQTSEFFLNGVSLGVLSYAQTGADGTVGYIKIESVDSINTGTIKVDNMALGTVPEPSSLVALSAFGFGALGLIRRRKA